MKIDRLIGILSILLQQDKVTAPYLAEKFEVSRRTINRDIEDLCKAGIPLVTSQGTGGGISIMEGYKIDRTLLTSSDMKSILTGLRSLDSVSGTNKYQQLMEKLSAGNSGMLTANNHIVIDLSSWYKTSLAPKIELIQNAIEDHALISFQYYSPSGGAKRTIEPYLLVFQWSSWYVWGYCRDREDFRLFKLGRIMELARQEPFAPRELPPFEIKVEEVFPWTLDVKARFDPSVKWRLIEEYGFDSFEEQEDGTLLFQFGFSEKENLFSWLMTFGDKAELLEPVELRKEFSLRLQNIFNKYKET